MRHYPSDSPEAMTRVVALTLLVDGAIDLSELETLRRNDIVNRLGLDHARFDKVIHEFCDDMLAYVDLKPSGQYELDPESIGHLLAEVGNPELQKKVLSVMLDIVNADGNLAHSETALVAQAIKHWKLDLVH
ncbi:MAG: TerB family tellurite resistance protein [Propionivibrio sp.]|uniref:TerB family tellurite resistance protein n=1 Tax=Propionivibrio sp. TaxID=2212460 RepID=UPI001A61AFBF|nr:TerB family tellurite resistance protein [Propionivibrio sp.]MBL8414277.1 TerB family tellurite resistance protein [Propionivibrio sp.]